MIIKRGDVEILGVIDDDEHALDDNGTRDVLVQAIDAKRNKKTEAEANTETTEN